MTTAKKRTIKKRFKGVVVSDKMDRTVIVQIDSVRTHKKYNKKYTVSKRYKVHDTNNKAKVGDIVEFVECRPLSKTKKWKLVYKPQVVA